jgi:SHS2 domain-containing protein
MGRYEVLDDVAIADCALEVEGTDLDDLFATAARALAELMVDPVTLTPSLERRIDLEAPALDLLFFDWLSELIGLRTPRGRRFPRSRCTSSGGRRAGCARGSWAVRCTGARPRRCARTRRP